MTMAFKEKGGAPVVVGTQLDARLEYVEFAGQVGRPVVVGLPRPQNKIQKQKCSIILC